MQSLLHSSLRTALASMLTITLLAGPYVAKADATTGQLTWRDAATGKLLAASDFFEPMTFGSLITPGFGGHIYFATGKGSITLQVMPAPAPVPPGFSLGAPRSSVASRAGLEPGVPRRALA